MGDREFVADGLPTYLTRFVGRRQELVELSAALTGGSRLVTVSAVGGSGKTRLAIECAREFNRAESGPFPDGVFWVSLSATTEPSVLSRLLAVALSPSEVSGESLDGALARLARAQALVVLDNCEQLADGCTPIVEQVLAACPGVVVLATSRTVLGSELEQVMRLAPLAGDAADLFVDRAARAAPVYLAIEPNTATIDEICSMLNGMPLAIELAAGWIRVLSAGDLRDEIRRNLDILSTTDPGVDERHQSMRAVLDSSWRWLGDRERVVLGRLSVFVAGFTREAARSVAGADLSTLASLAEKSLIQRIPDAFGGTRYQIHELVRVDAWERHVAEDETAAEAVRGRHCDHFLAALVERTESTWEPPQPEWFDAIRADQADIRGAFAWALDRGDAERAVRMVAGLCECWVYLSSPWAPAELLEHTLEVSVDVSSPLAVRARGRTLVVAGYKALSDSRFDLAFERFAEGIAWFERLADRVALSWALRAYAHALLLTRDWRSARLYVERSLALSHDGGDRAGTAWCLHDLGEIAMAAGDLARCGSYLQDALGQFERLRMPVGVYRSRLLLGHVHLQASEPDRALEWFRLGFELRREIYFRLHFSSLLEGLGTVAAELHAAELAARLFGAASSSRRECGYDRYPHLEPSYQLGQAISHRRLGEQVWQLHYAVGEQLSMLDAVRLCGDAIEELRSTLRHRRAGLTERELEVVRLLAVGLSNDAIARRLVISPRTVHTHVRSIFGKLGVSSRTAAAHESARLKLV